MIEKDKHWVQFVSKSITTDERVESNLANNSTPVDHFEVDVFILERIITGGARSEVDSLMATVETRIYYAITTAREGY